MGKIPRVSLGDRPSGVPSGAAISPTAVAAPLATLGSVAESAFVVASEAEQRQALVIRDAMEKKQAILNEVEANTRSANFDATLRENAESVKKEFFDAPDKAVSQFVENARFFADSEVHDAAADVNSQVGLDVARQTGARIATMTAEMYTWASLRQTQRAKGQTQEVINSTAAAAEHLATPDALQRHIDVAQTRFAQQFVAVYGKEADAKLHEMAAASTKGFFAVVGDRDPLNALSALEDTKGPAAKYLTPTERDSLRRQSKASLDGRHVVRELDIAREAAGENKQALELLNLGKLKPELVLSLQNRNTEAQKAAAVDQSFTPEQRKVHVEQLKQQGAALEAIGDINRRGLRFDPADHVDSDTAMLEQQAQMFKKLKGSPADLKLLQEHQQRLVLARAKREISDGAFTSMTKDLNLAFDKSVKSEQMATWGFHWLSFQNAREAGNAELNRLFRGKLKNATPKQKSAAWQNYITQFSDASQGDVDVKAEATRNMARQAASYETGVFVGEGD